MNETSKSPESWKRDAKEMARKRKNASEIISDAENKSAAKNIAIVSLSALLLMSIMILAVVTIYLSNINHKNDREWRELFASYDYVYQDGQGYNYYNSDVGGDVTNGTENSETEEPGESTGNEN